ncbi:MAG: GIY-YIG nuclease family protein [Patescibacteria group bacterium]
MITLKQKAAKFPKGPGAYQFFDSKNNILYIGRATSLRNRVANYFRADIDPRIAEMVSLASEVKFIATETVLDAILLEANLIKKYWPKYNIKDKDNRSFAFILIDKKQTYPCPIIIRGHELNKFPKLKNIFGPYRSVKIANDILKTIRKVFSYSKCKPNQGRPCFDRQIGLCPGICTGEITKTAYRQNIDNLIAFLKGDKKRLLEKMIKASPSQVESLKYLNDLLFMTRDELENINFNRIEGFDISHLSGKETYGSMSVFINGEAETYEYRLFKINGVKESDDMGAMRQVIERRLNHLDWDLPDLILIDGGKPQVSVVSKIFEAKNIKIPLVGISKFSGDKLVFPAKTKKSLQALISANKNLLLKVRDEAHRFANRGRKRGSKIK